MIQNSRNGATELDSFVEIAPNPFPLMGNERGNMPHNHLDKLSQDAIEKHGKRRSILFAEESAGYLLQEHGRDEAASILRKLAEHIEDYG